MLPENNKEFFIQPKSSRQIKREFKSWFFKQHTKSLTDAIINSDETIIANRKMARRMARYQIRQRLIEQHRTSKKDRTSENKEQ
jgi:hypothetical protein